jgi:hypothetical protein
MMRRRRRRKRRRVMMMMMTSLIAGKLQHQVGFHATYVGGKHSGPLPFYPGTNYGSGFSASTGTFITPVSGLYFLEFTATPHQGARSTAVIKKNGSVVCNIEGGEDVTAEQSVTCVTVQRLATGDQVWVESPTDMHNYGTHFTGFLINAD